MMHEYMGDTVNIAPSGVGRFLGYVRMRDEAGRFVPESERLEVWVSDNTMTGWSEIGEFYLEQELRDLFPQEMQRITSP